MVIIILGAGQVGSMLAANLASGANNVTVVDIDSARLRSLQDRLDIRTVEGSAAYPPMLAQAGARDADLLIAVTSSDEINMMACQVAHSLFNVPTKIARVRAPEYIARADRLFCAQAIPVDVLISPEGLVTRHISNLVRHPGTLQVIDFAAGRLQLVTVAVPPASALVGVEIAALEQELPKDALKLLALFRADQALLPAPKTRIAAGDELLVLAKQDQMPKLLSLLGQAQRPYKRIIIAGGGNIGARVARELETDFQVKVIEARAARCEQLAQNLTRAVILNGHASDRELLLETGIDGTDLVIALTNDDEDNVMASMLAKRLGARQVITLINNPAYVNLVQGGVIDVAVSPQHVTLGALLTYIRRGDVVAVHTLHRGMAEALEVVAHGDPTNSKVVGRPIADIDLPAGALIGAAIRAGQVHIAQDEMRIENNDHLVLILLDKSNLPKLERLFQVGLKYFS